MRTPSLWALALLTAAASAPAAEDPKTPYPLRVLYVGNRDSARGKEFAAFFKERFTKVDVADRAGFDPAQARDADVVVLDWSQQDKVPPRDVSPLGDRKRWSKPTVLLGSAGHLMAGPWQVSGGWG
jgi:hypothetical protein